MVVFPDPFGPSSPMTSPASTSRDTWSTASLGPYHLVSCSTTMTGGMPGGGAAPPGGVAVRRSRATSNPDCVTYSNTCGLCELRALPAGPSGSWAVMKLAFSRPCSTRMYSYAFRIPVGL